MIAPQSLPRIPTFDEIVPRRTAITNEFGNLISSIAKNVDVDSACFANVVLPVAELWSKHSGEVTTTSALKYCAPDAETQREVWKAETVFWRADWRRDPKWRKLLHAASCRAEELTTEERELWRWVKISFGQRLEGFDPADPVRQDRLRRYREINDLYAEFNQNLKEDTSGAWFSPEELDGIPVQDRQPLEPTTGKEFYRFSNNADLFLKYAKNPNTRKQMLEGDGTKLSQNAEIFRKVVVARDQLAREDGDKHHADTQLLKRCVESVDSIKELLEQAAEILLPYQRQTYERLLNRKIKDNHQNSTSKPTSVSSGSDATMKTKLEAWDAAYYKHLIEQEQEDDSELFMEYFPLQHTFEAMLQVFAEFWQIEFREIPDKDLESHRWHEDVRVWAVWDIREGAHQSFIGFLYGDILERPNKHNNGAAVDLQPGFLRPDGSRVYSAVTLMCNFRRNCPQGCDVDLLTHKNVITMFHELGHCMHDLFSRTRFSVLHGTTYLPNEFTEGIGKMLEYWCWVPSVLERMSLHYTKLKPDYAKTWLEHHPGRDLPPAVIPEKLTKAHQAQHAEGIAYQTSKDVLNAIFDLAVHAPDSHEELLNLDIGKKYNDIWERVLLYRPPEPSWHHAHFHHIIHGMDGGYYAYVCATIYAGQMWEKIWAGNPESKEAWERFRREVLEPGASIGAPRILESVLGSSEAQASVLRSILDRRL